MVHFIETYGWLTPFAFGLLTLFVIILFPKKSKPESVSDGLCHQYDFTRYYAPHHINCSKCGAPISTTKIPDSYWGSIIVFLPHHPGTTA